MSEVWYVISNSPVYGEPRNFVWTNEKETDGLRPSTEIWFQNYLQVFYNLGGMNDRE